MRHGSDPQGAARVARGPGKILREAREAAGFSLDEMARRTRLQPRVIEAVEADAYEQLAGTGFVKGYIRLMAREVRLDPALPLAATLITANVVYREFCDPAAAMSFLDTKYGHAYAWPSARVRVLHDPVIERVGFEHAGEGIPDGWDPAVKGEYLRSVGIEPGPECLAWNYMSAEMESQWPTPALPS